GELPGLLRPGLGEALVGGASQQERARLADLVHLDGVALGAAVELEGPAQLAGLLDDAVEGHERGDDDLPHGRSLSRVILQGARGGQEVRRGRGLGSTRAPPSTTATANPAPRTRQTSRMTAIDPEAVSASAGRPSSTSPAVNTARYPNRAAARETTSSVATVASIITPVVSPAPTPPAPVASAYRGSAENSR